MLGVGCMWLRIFCCVPACRPHVPGCLCGSSVCLCAGSRVRPICPCAHVQDPTKAQRPSLKNVGSEQATARIISPEERQERQEGCTKELEEYKVWGQEECIRCGGARV